MIVKVIDRIIDDYKESPYPYMSLTDINECQFRRYWADHINYWREELGDEFDDVVTEMITNPVYRNYLGI